MPASSHNVFVALGSNLGNSREILNRAITRLQGMSTEPLLRSSLWETTPVDCPPGSPAFLNAAVGIVSGEKESPESLLEKLKAMEVEFGRGEKSILNEPRPLDLDLIAFGTEIRSTGKLVLPHPRAHLRRFVLAPLSEIAPELILPGQTKSVSQLLRNLTSAEVVRKLE